VLISYPPNPSEALLNIVRSVDERVDLHCFWHEDLDGIRSAKRQRTPFTEPPISPEFLG
jgi:hypothetical protein